MLSELFQSFPVENKLESHKKVCENKHFCKVIMPFEDTKILEFNQYQKSYKPSPVISADLECLIQQIDGGKNDLKIHSQQKQANIFHQFFQCLQHHYLKI